MTMTNKEYIQKINRLKEIEAMVKNPDSSLEKIDELIAAKEKEILTV